MQNLTISLSPRQAARVQEAVETGAYASNSEVVQDALLLWEQREQARALESARLKQAYAEGLASGEGREVSSESLLAAFRAKAGVRG